MHICSEDKLLGVDFVPTVLLMISLWTSDGDAHKNAFSGGDTQNKTKQKNSMQNTFAGVVDNEYTRIFEARTVCLELTLNYMYTLLLIISPWTSNGDVH